MALHYYTVAQGILYLSHPEGLLRIQVAVDHRSRPEDHTKKSYQVCRINPSVMQTGKKFNIQLPINKAEKNSLEPNTMQERVTGSFTTREQLSQTLRRSQIEETPGNCRKRQKKGADCS